MAVVMMMGGNDKPKFELERVAIRTDEAVLGLDVAVQVATPVDGAHCVFCVCFCDDGDVLCVKLLQQTKFEGESACECTAEGTVA